MEAIANGYKVFLYNHNGTSEHERAGVERFIERRVDAIILTYAVDVGNLLLLKESGIPVVQIEREQTGDTHAVLVDNRAGTASAMRHLLELGHRRIAFIGGDPTRYPRSLSRGCSVEEERLEAYTGSLREAGASVDERLIQLGEYIARSEEGSNIAGYRGMKTILKLADRPTAVVAGCDILAAGALQAIYETRLRIPDDISVVGYDDTLAASLAPRLTTVAQPMAELGRTAIQLALSEIADPEIMPKTVTLSPRLVVRDSTAAPPPEA
jgi:LacI family transcriptional regulator